MSVILEVLKKLDREKPFRRDYSPNIADEILKPDFPRPTKKIYLQMMISLTAIVTAVMTYVLIKEFGLLPQPLPPVLSRPNEPIRPVPSVPSESNLKTKTPPPVPMSPPEPVQKVPPVLPSREQPIPPTKTEITRIVPNTETVPDSKITGTPAPPVESKPSSPPLEWRKLDQGGLPVKRESLPAEPVKKSPETRTTEPVKGPPSLTISAIVWYEEPSLRFAVINGLKAVEGDFIEGAKVLEIHRTSIRFLYQDKPFEVSISR